MRFRLTASALLLAIPLLAACGNETTRSDSSPASSDAFTVATAFYPITEIVQQVAAGTNIEIIGLTPPGVGAHDHELTARQLEDLTKVDAVFYLAGGLQPSVEKAVAQLSPATVIVNLMDHAQTISATKEQEDHGDEAGHDDHSNDEKEDQHNDHDHGDTDPHVWLDPANMTSMTQAVVSTLSKFSPNDAETLDTNGKKFVAQLDSLGKEIDTRFVKCASRALVTSHDAFGYFAARAKLNTVPIAGVDPTNEPSAKQLEEIATVARNAKATTVFFEAQLPDGLAKTVAASVNADVSVIDPIETISSADLDAGKNYISVQKENIANIAKGLRCSS